MRKAIKYIVPLVGILYCIAFFEVEVSATQHQSFNDEYDSYTNPHSLNLNSSRLNLDVFHVGFGLPSFSISLNHPYYFKKPSPGYLTECSIALSHKLFISNCTWLI